MKFIEHIIEPDKLLLSWQALESVNRSRYVVAKVVKKGDKAELRYLTESDDFKSALGLGFAGHPAFKLRDSEKFESHVIEAFTRRLPPRNRGDFSKYLQLRAIPSDSELSNFALLGYTGAKLPDDGFELVHPFENIETEFEVIFEVAGYRYHMDELPIQKIETGVSVDLIPEPDNQFDSKAILLEIDGKKIGYIDRARNDLVHRYLEAGFNVKAEIFRKNGTASRPVIYIFAKFSPSGK